MTFYTVILLLVISSTSCIKEVPDQKPNVIIIMADDLGYGDISCYGNTTIRTPNLDVLASEGVKFTDFHSNGAVCSPTRAALLTGKYQQRTGVEGVITAKNHRDVGLDLNEITIAEEFKMHGYNCAMYGKWHLGYSKEYNPTLQGFDEFTGFVSGNIDYHAHIDQEGYLDWWKGNKIDNEAGYSTDLITGYGVKYIESHHSDRDNKPFFLYLAYEAPHYPYQKRDSKILRKVGVAGTEPVDRDSIPSIYREMVEIMDEGIGSIIQKLKETGQYDNTIMVFLSDNGASQNGNNGVLRGYKGGAYEGGSRVPAIISFPGKINNGINNQTILTMDLLPTLLDFIGQKPSSENIDGISIKDHLLDGSDLPERNVFFAFKSRSFIRSGDWKLVRISNNDEVKIELYNLKSDLGEKIDLSQDHPEMVKKLSAKLKTWGTEVRKDVDVVSN